MKKYGLQLRIPPAQQKQAAAKPPLPPPAFAFRGEDAEDDIESEISRQASKNKALQKIEEQHKKALEEDPSVFDYDGVYDEMKERIARPKIQDRAERKSKYIEVLMEKAKERGREQEITYERKLLKDRSKEDHLYVDKEKFVTSAYKKKLAEQAKWLEEERLRQLREEKEDVTKKKDLSDFYFGLNKNVAFGARVEESKSPATQEREKDTTPQDRKASQSESKAPIHSAHGGDEVDSRAEASRHAQNHPEKVVESTSTEVSAVHVPEKEKLIAEQSPATQSTAAKGTNERYKRSEDAVAAARERFLARKRAREQ